jgi:hypothetical protein
MNKNYGSTKKKHIRYRFNTNNSTTEKPIRRVFSFFYQIASFADTNKDRKTYHMKKYVFDTKTLQIARVEEYQLSLNYCRKFYKKYPDHAYKQYNVYDLNIVNEPSKFDLQTAISPNLANKVSDNNKELNTMYNTVIESNIDYTKLHQGSEKGSNYKPNFGNMAPSSDLENSMLTDFAKF